MVNTNVTPSTNNAGLVGLRFFFETTCKQPAMKDCLHFRTEPRKLPVVFSAEEVFEILRVAPGPRLKYLAALSISYGTGVRASEELQSQGHGYRQRSDVDPRREGQGRQGSQGNAVARIAGASA
ncbi:hypothetical protein VWY34_10065 [Phaeobacter sp. JH20_02]